ncbi:hypothetical protein DPMN_039438 [Dreissena polymorpha]|uniref:Uncharacterized protein n=1 Tax=Dreissena polymorpha TaxID=45954 RepID=A0A9D4MF06_DREPO|nr:hypothetical protein DPMN_039438 [Dreissena polymorpha]
MIRVTGLHMEEDFHLCDTSLQKQEGQMSSSTDVFFGGSSQTVSTSLSCSEGKEEDFNKESLLQLSSLNKLVTEKKFSSCVLTVATSWADLPETCQVYYQASSDNKAPLWKQHNKKCQYPNLDVDTE